jgi:two-component system response regulator (stage 0 sporulation protein F)
LAELKILVVDDNREFSENVRDALELFGYKASTAFNGYKAVEMVAKDPPDLVLIDVKMPGMDGLETFRKIKKIAPQTNVFMLTAFAVEDLIVKAMQEGAIGYFKKPFDFNLLLSLISNVEKTRAA